MLILKNTSLLTIIGIMVLTLISCKKDDEVTGPPVINQVILVEDKSEVENASPGAWISIEGKNLLSVKEGTLNGNPIALQTSYMTNCRILFPIPTNLPSDPSLIDNTIILTDGDGNAVSKTFSVAYVPIISSLSDDIVFNGVTIEVTGEFFTGDLKFVFPSSSGVPIEITPDKVSPDGTSATVTVKGDISVGKVIVKNQFGEGESPTAINDPQFNWVDFDDNKITADAIQTVTNPSSTQPNKLLGNYGIFDKTIGGTWSEGILSGKVDKLVNDKTGTPEDYVMAFEVQFLEPFTYGTIRFEFIDDRQSEPGRNDRYYWLWEPTEEFSSKNYWQKVEVPFTEFVWRREGGSWEDVGEPITAKVEYWGKAFNIVYENANTESPDGPKRIAFAIDNIRFVKK